MEMQIQTHFDKNPYHMRSTVDKSIPIENIHYLAHFPLW